MADAVLSRASTAVIALRPDSSYLTESPWFGVIFRGTGLSFASEQKPWPMPSGCENACQALLLQEEVIYFVLVPVFILKWREKSQTRYALARWRAASWPQAAEMSWPRGRLMNEGKPASVRIF
jgi:hypothetical protein